MKTVLYNAGVRIAAVMGDSFDTANDIPAGYEDAFIDIVTRALDMIDGCHTGQALLQEIAGSGHLTTIFFGNGAITGPYPANDQNKDARLLRRLVSETMVTTQARSSVQLAQTPGAPRRPARPQLLKTVLDDAERAGTSREKIAKLLGITVAELDEVAGMQRRVTPSQYYLLLIHLYEWIPSGAGCDTTIRLDATATPQHVDTSVYKKDWTKSPLHLVLGHELVHAWRMMKGRRFYQGGYEEEQMTVGLPPFHKLPFSENRLRAEFKYALAPRYGTYSGTTNSPLAEGLRQTTENPSDKSWREFLEKAHARRTQHASPTATVKGSKITWN